MSVDPESGLDLANLSAPVALPASPTLSERFAARREPSRVFPLDMTLSPEPRMGWATATFREGPSTYHLGLSYLTDAFGDIAEAAARIVEGQAQAWVGWEDEPGEHRLFLTRTEPWDKHPFGVVQFELWTDAFALNDDPFVRDFDGHRRAWAAVSIPDFQAGMIALLERLLAENGGAHRFALRWFGTIGDSAVPDGEFPLAALARLRAVPVLGPTVPPAADAS